jgi:DNA polymerase-1
LYKRFFAVGFHPAEENVRNLQKGKSALKGCQLRTAPTSRKWSVCRGSYRAGAKMLEAFRMGEDLHCRTASVLLGREITKADKDERSLAKAVNFSLLYGQKGPGLKEYARNAFDVDMTEAEANGFYDKFFHESSIA